MATTKKTPAEKKAKPPVKRAPVESSHTGTGICGCGCGGVTPSADRTRGSRGQIKGQPLRFLKGHSSCGVAGDFWLRVRIGDGDTCWPWTGASDKKGYGHLNKTAHGRNLAHVKALELSGVEIPIGAIVMHLLLIF